MESTQKQSIHFILTGGTIDSYYEGTKDTVVPNKISVIPDYIKGLKLKLESEFTTICMKDSRDIDLTDMEMIRTTVEESSMNHFLVTIGTYCMPDVARYLEANIKRKDCVMIFTAAMIPLKDFASSDAAFNLGFSIAEIFHLDPGIYVCMNGQIFQPGEIAKLIGQGRFVSIFGN